MISGTTGPGVLDWQDAERKTMTLAPLLAASPVIQMHVFAVLAAFAIGIVQLTGPKGTLRAPHRGLALGRTYTRGQCQ